jgi:hypothetical protein
MKSSRKTLYLKTIAIAVCLLFISLSLYGFVQAAEKKAPDPGIKNFLKKPIHLLSSLIGTISNSGKESDSSSAYDLNSNQKNKITQNFKSEKVSDDD